MCIVCGASGIGWIIGASRTFSNSGKVAGIRRREMVATAVAASLAAISSPPAWAASDHPAAAGQDPHRPADSIVLNGRIYTVNPKQPWAQALAVRDGRILAIGSEKDIAAYRGKATRVIDAGGHMVLPGFVDTHVYFTIEPYRALFFEFSASTIAETQAKLKGRAAAVPNEPIVLGWGMLTGEASEITHKELDAAVPDRPVLIIDGHHAFANSLALDKAGISRDTPDPPGGEIIRDPSSGEATGLLKEAATRMAALRLAPRPTREAKLAAFHKKFQDAARTGLVRMHSVGYDDMNIDIFEELRRRGKLTARMLVASIADPPTRRPADPPTLTAEHIAEFEKFRQANHDNWIDGGVVKIWQDALVEMHTASMLEPYTDAPNTHGHSYWSAEELNKMLVELDRRGFRVLIHATGDRSAREVLNAFEAARTVNKRADSVFRVEHAEHIDPADLPRFAKLGVIASVHPGFVEGGWKEQEERIGTERMRFAFPWRSIVAAGGQLAAGTDYPSYTTDPWVNVQEFVTRRHLPEQRLTVAEAIDGYTLGAAKAGGLEKTEGSLETGKVADLIIVSQDLFKAKPQEIAKTKVLTTMVGGKIVHRAT